MIGKYITCANEVNIDGQTFKLLSEEQVWTSTNGVLAGMTIVDKNGAIVCSDPMVYNQFRGPDSYITCNNE